MKLLSLLIIIPTAVFFVGFAIANREAVLVNFDPVNRAAPIFALEVPLFGVVFASVLLGIFAGGVTAWWRQGKWRAKARDEAKKVRAFEKDRPLDAVKEPVTPTVAL
jgi:hypothetical protein